MIQRNLLLSEFYNVRAYFDRLICLLNSQFVNENKEITQCLHLNFKKIKFIINSHLQILDTHDDEECSSSSTDYYLEKISYYNDYIESLIKISPLPAIFESIEIKYLNSLLQTENELHSIIEKHNSVVINIPSFVLAELSKIQDDNSIPFFTISENSFRELSNYEGNDIIIFINLKKKSAHQRLLTESLNAIAINDFKKALNLLNNARNLIENAETLTTLAWAYSLNNDHEKAKSLCGLAIKCDQQYGPALNDMGTYLLNEGKIEESLKWFELSKRAINYPNREYPYINCGRAYILLNNYKDALREFSIAITLAPHHEELHNIISRIRNSLNNNEAKSSI